MLVEKASTQHTTKAHGYGLAWPLNALVPWIHHVRFCWKHWDLCCTPREQLLLDFEQACAALSERLGDKMTFFESGLVIPFVTANYTCPFETAFVDVVLLQSVCCL